MSKYQSFDSPTITPTNCQFCQWSWEPNLRKKVVSQPPSDRVSVNYMAISETICMKHYWSGRTVFLRLITEESGNLNHQWDDRIELFFCWVPSRKVLKRPTTVSNQHPLNHIKPGSIHHIASGRHQASDRHPHARAAADFRSAGDARRWALDRSFVYPLILL